MESPLPLSPEISDFSGTDPTISDLARSIRRAEGSFAIFIATCNDAAWRDRCIAQLKDQVPGSLVVLCSAATEDPLLEIGEPESPPACIHLIRLELAVPGDESRLAPLRMLNLHREHWRSLRCPVVFWLPEYLFGLLMRRAPDFADWRSASLTFTPPTGHPTQFPTAVSKEHLETTEAPLWDASMRENRIAELSKRLGEQLPPQAATAADHIQAEWCDELARLLILDRRSHEEARAYHALALAYWEGRDDSEHLAWSWVKMGDAFWQIGDSTAASSAFFSYHRIASELAASDPANTEWQRELSISLNKLGDLAVSRGDVSGAERRFAEGLAIAERLAASDPANAGWQRDLSVSLNRLGGLAVARGDLSGAERRFAECLAIAECLASSDPANTELQRDLFVSLNKLGDVAVSRGDLSGAERRFAECLSIAERLAASDSANVRWQRELSVSLNKLGDLAVSRGDLSGAERRFAEGLAIAERLAASDPANAGWQRDLSVSLDKLGKLAVARGDVSGAERCFAACLAIAERLTASDPANAGWQRDMTVSLVRLGNLSVARDDLSAAERRFAECLAIAERLTTSDPANAGWQRDMMCTCAILATKIHIPQGQWPEALPLMERAFAISEKLVASDPSNVTWENDLLACRRHLAEIRSHLAPPPENNPGSNK